MQELSGVSSRATASGLNTADEWRLMDKVGPGVDEWSGGAHVMPVLGWKKSLSSLAVKSLASWDKSSTDVEARAWLQQHKHVQKSERPDLGKVPTHRNLCWEAGVCIDKEPYKQLIIHR